MCGIAGVVAYRKNAAPVDLGELGRIDARLAPRGPDGKGDWIAPDRRAALVHRRLAVIAPGPDGAQPMWSGDGRYVISFNGEIYNYRDLRRDLTERGHILRTHSDTEVILTLYAEHGPDLLPMLRGMFAFVLWDRQNRTLFAARDAFGIKPLYWSDNGGTVRLCSTVKALAAGGGIDRTLDQAAKVAFLTIGYVPEPDTILASVKALPAGSHLTVAPDRVPVVSRWYDAVDHLRNAMPRRIGDRVELLRAALDDSVRHHLVADVPVGAFLSGGRDSTSLIACARRVGAVDLRTTTLGFTEFAGTLDNEAPLAEEAARIYGTDHRTIRVERSDFEADLDRFLDAMDQPSTDGVNTWFVAKATAERGLKVALSGVGADEWLGGYPSFHQVPKLMGLAGAIPGGRYAGRLLRRAISPIVGHVASPKIAGVIEYGTTAADAWLLRRALFMPWELDRELDPDEVEAGWRRLDLPARLTATAAGHRSWRGRIAALEASWYMAGQLLRDADWAAMAHGLEIRVPFVDTALFEALLPSLVGQDPVSKDDLPAAAGEGYPAGLADRPKRAFAVPVREWLETQGRSSATRGLRGWARTVLARYEADMKAVPATG